MNIDYTDDFDFCFKDILNTDFSYRFFSRLKIDDKMNYLDITDDYKVSYLPTSKYVKVIKDGLDKYDNIHRQTTKIGKIVTKYLGEDLNLGEVENISNIYKNKIKLLRLEGYNLEIVDGDEIPKWYHRGCHSPGQGTLNKSCMVDGYKNKRTHFFSKISKVCKLTILTDSNNKLLGRALLWKTNMGWYMDRVYTVHDEDVILFNRNAEENNYLTWNNGDNIHESLKVRIPLKFSSVDREEYPYLDTFYNYYPWYGLLSNKPLNKLNQKTLGYVG